MNVTEDVYFFCTLSVLDFHYSVNNQTIWWLNRGGLLAKYIGLRAALNGWLFNLNES